MISFSCPKCRVVNSAKTEHAGKRALCKGCRAEIVIPDDDLILPVPLLPNPGRHILLNIMVGIFLLGLGIALTWFYMRPARQAVQNDTEAVFHSNASASLVDISVESIDGQVIDKEFRETVDQVTIRFIVKYKWAGSDAVLTMPATWARGKLAVPDSFNDPMFHGSDVLRDIFIRKWEAAIGDSIESIRSGIQGQADAAKQLRDHFKRSRSETDAIERHNRSRDSSLENGEP